MNHFSKVYCVHRILTLADPGGGHQGRPQGPNSFILMQYFGKKIVKQECIPVGCVPAERWPYSGGDPPKKDPPRKFGGPPKKRHPPPKFGGTPPAKFGGTPPENLEDPPENLEDPPWKFGGIPPKKTPPKFGGPPHSPPPPPPQKFGEPPHPVDRITDACKNITLAKTSFRPVIINGSAPTLGVGAPEVNPDSALINIFSPLQKGLEILQSKINYLSNLSLGSM